MDVLPQPHPHPHPPVPSIAAAAAADAKPATTRGMRPRRQSSVPAESADVHVKKRSANIIRTQTASPEVISSLIDSLSAISASKDNYFENLPLGYGESLSVPTSPLDRHDAPSAFGPFQSLSRQPSNLAVDDACEPPVIKTSKPPSGYSPLTAPKKKDKENSLRSYMSRGGGSSASVHSAQSLRSVSSIGNISIEAGIPRKPSDSSTRTSAESKRSVKAHRSLMFMPSRERLRLKDAERKRHTIQTQTQTQTQATDAAVLPDIARKPVPKRSFAEDTISEEPVVAESSRAAASRPARSILNFVDGNDGGSPTENNMIPERGSSLRHSGSPSRKSKKGDGRKSTRHDSYRASTVLEEDETVDQDIAPHDKILKELEEKDDEVARRIRELRKQKMLREKIAGKQPVGHHAGASLGGARVSSGATIEPSPTSSVSSMSEKRMQDPTKAHRVLGITMQHSVPDMQEPQPPENQNPSTKVDKTRMQMRGHTRTRSSTTNDIDELTPLPINYTLALQSLERLDSHPPPPSSGNTSTTISERASSTPPRRAKSMAVGGRSAASRKSMIIGAPAEHRSSTGVTTHESSNNVSRPIRSASEELATRRETLASPPSTSNSLKHRPTVKKKRWSHPDLPVEAEKAHNAKVDALNAATSRGVQIRAVPVQSPPHSVIEERPASTDSIDMEVEGYLNSPRLSQRIRHPQTGRVISFSEVGDPQGFAVFVCVGMGLTRYVMAFYDQLALTLKLRLITPDRPGIGGSQVDPNGTPLSWPDDVLVICQTLKITKFSLLAHSAGAVYALATSLRMPQHIRGQVHLLAPWIPPSQMAPIGINQDQPPTQQLPRSQRFLRALPPSLLKVANSTFLSATSASLQRTGPKSSPRTKRKSVSPAFDTAPQERPVTRPELGNARRESLMKMDQIIPKASSLSLALANPADPNYEKARQMKEAFTFAERQRQHDFDERLTFAIWDRATAHANPATDLIVCLETKQTIGFRYEDINRSVVIHHGSKDTRVPVDNIRWLGRLMRKCEVRILDGEQHGLMASAQVMGNVLTEMASDWEDWTTVVQGKAHGERSISRKRTAERLRNIASRHGKETTY